MPITSIFAGPGCGKTTACLEFASAQVARGVDPIEIAYVVFQRSAAAEACDRVGIEGRARQELWWRTLHSTCYRLGSVRPELVVTADKLRVFGEKIGDPIDPKLAVEGEEMADLAAVILAMQDDRKEDEPERPSKILSLYQQSRLASRTVAELDHCRTEPHPKALERCLSCPNTAAYRGVVEEYERWKAGDLVDFVDMLARILQGVFEPPAWKYAIVDEAQDLSPLQWAVVEKLFMGGPEMTLLAGDDDQAIFSFQMAEAEGFLKYRHRGLRLHLRQTHRFGRAIVDMAAQVAGRLEVREPKDILPAAHETFVRRGYEMDPAAWPAGTRFLLHRHRRGCAELARLLISENVPFVNERGLSPLSRYAEIAGYAAIAKLRARQALTGQDLGAIAGVVPSCIRREGDRIPLIVRGFKKKMKEAAPTVTFAVQDVLPWFESNFLQAVDMGDWSVANIEFPEYYEAVSARGFRPGVDAPGVVVTTIHGSKGREADYVDLWDEMLPKCGRDPAEHRVSYVGATRARKGLTIMGDRLIENWQTVHYPYPVDDQ